MHSVKVAERLVGCITVAVGSDKINLLTVVQTFDILGLIGCTGVQYVLRNSDKVHRRAARAA